MQTWRYFLAGLGILAAITIASSIAQAGFDQAKVIENEVFTNTGSKDTVAIQRFLVARGSVLGGYTENGRSAAQIIADAASAHSINPEILLAILQRETSLIGTGTSYDTVNDPSKKLKTAMGYGCPDSGGCDPKYAGFTNQIDGAAFQLRYNYNGSVTKKFTDFQVDQTMSFDGQVVNISNQATASLYRYTPHIAASQSFYNIFFSYFTLYASHYVMQNSYPTLAPGDSYKFGIKFLNSGNTTWDTSVVRLATDRPKDRVSAFLRQNLTGNGDPTMWSKDNRVGMNESSVAPGSVGSWDFYMAVPTNMKPGSYREYFRPVADGIQPLDDDRTFWDITVANHQAKWGGQNFGTKTVESGQSFRLEVKLQNSGQTTWRNFGATPVRLAAARPDDRVSVFTREDLTGRNPSGWATPSRVSMVQPTVAPGATGTFDFWYTVPAGMAPGTYREYFRPVHEGVGMMNDLGIYFDLTVAPQPASYVSQSSYPGALAKGESVQLRAKFLNTGQTTWQKNGSTPLRLATLRPTDRSPLFIRDDVVGHNPSGWISVNRVSMVEESVAPGSSGTFAFWYSVPGDKPPGVYREYFGLIQEGVGALPDNGLYWDITVK